MEDFKELIISQANLLTLYVTAFVYAQLINAFESLVWAHGFWVLTPPFFADNNKKPENDGYHLALAFFYLLPFAILRFSLFEIVLGGWIVWILNDLMWHFWSVQPKHWVEWMRFYFNPRDGKVLWYARLKIFFTEITPKRMFYITILRVGLLPLLLCLPYHTISL